MADHLHRLAVERIQPFRCFLELLSFGPPGVRLTRLPVNGAALHPDFGDFRLSCFEGGLQRGGSCSAVQRNFKRLVEQCYTQYGIMLIELKTDRDHVHVFVSAPPRYSPANLANLLKGYTLRHLCERHLKLKQICGKNQLWTQAYFVVTVGQVSADTIRPYISECQGK